MDGGMTEPVMPIPAPQIDRVWIIRQWPWSSALGERWFALPPARPQEPWPGIRWFPSFGEAYDWAQTIEDARKAADG